MYGVKRPVQQSGDDGPEAGDSTGSGPGLPASRSQPADTVGSSSGEGGSPPPVNPARRASTPGRPGFRLIALATAAAAAVTVGIVFAVTQPGSPVSHAASDRPGHASAPIHVVSVTPSSQATGVDGADPITVTFSGPVSPSSPKPTLTPSVPGSWAAVGDSLTFTPTLPFQPSTKITVQIPAGASGVRSARGGLLSTAVTSQFTTGTYSQAGLAVLLAKQGYLPLTWAPERSGVAMAELQGGDPAAQTPQGEAYAPPPGTFTWQPGYPATLTELWSPDQANVVLKGAVMAFQSEHNMTIDGSLTPQLWNALFEAQARGEQNANGYSYAIASKNSPETLTIWHDGQVVLHSLANTGIAVSPTVDGTFPVYLRFRNTIMSGFNPDGSYYSDPVSFASYFNGGDAVHAYYRGSYGWPQSLGCIELPYNAAAQAYPYLTYGSLVTVVG